MYRERIADVGRWVRGLGGRAPDVPDLVQEVFLVAYRRLPHFEGSNMAGWLYQITRRKMRDYRRLHWIKHLFTNETAGALEWRAAGADQLQQLESHEQREMLEHALAKLPTKQRVALVLFEIEGLSGVQIAEQLAVPINTVWGRIHQARRSLCSRLLRSQKLRPIAKRR